MDEIESRAALLPELAERAAGPTLAHFRQPLTVDDKTATQASDRFDPVTIADRDAEQAIRERIREAFPNDSIFGEEFGPREGTSAYRWVIDPIDGTRAYVCGAPTWGTLIGVLDESHAVAGLMDQPYTRERFIGTAGRSWFTRTGGDAQALRSSTKTDLGAAYLSATTRDLFDAARGEAEAFQLLDDAAQQTRYGLDCYAYCLVAAGTLDLVVEAGLQSYDIVALIPIVEGAGGIVTTWSGAFPEDGGQIIASANAALHEQALEILRPFAAA